MTYARIPEHAWQASTYSGANGGECVEWAPAHAVAHGSVPVRDSKVAGGPVLMVSPEGWTALVGLARSQGA
ncbi:DUF397 domain-containing protein [Streptomyces sp. SID4919]|uniref:DUF397 domain-containing protein n=1 Tax=unclassified Streptomyces TaxID=2593676 RepID=UPI000823C40A|nr:MULTISPECIES: DUF397 domain-containing protein [unclassified Streptomyces]MYY13032.1 DUF397 domain-containing protein [Streptomyces sp. SID4919]SCK23480.1 protein of unknown function [Streptomyces sp. AmelKG-E11A]